MVNKIDAVQTAHLKATSQAAEANVALDDAKKKLTDMQCISRLSIQKEAQTALVAAENAVAEKEKARVAVIVEGDIWILGQNSKSAFNICRGIFRTQYEFICAVGISL